MNVKVNGEIHEIDATQLTVSRLLEQLDIQQTTGMAVARNMSVVPKSRWGEETVEDGDEIEIVRATQGG
jgi:sulfur carrier protein